jgi:hemerythrin-like domain-containing protein
MLPVDLLVQEHRIIERMVPPIKKELTRMKETKEVDPNLIDVTVDFIRTYADHCHHGKEEGILFRELAKKVCPRNMPQQ